MTTDRLPRLLAVDDERNIAELATIWFDARHWEVATAASGPEAVAKAVDFEPDVVVLDVMLPGYDGFEVLRRLKLVDPRVVVIFSTARDGVDDRARGLAAGAEDYLVKPYSLHQLEARICELLAARPDRHLMPA